MYGSYVTPALPYVADGGFSGSGCCRLIDLCKYIRKIIKIYEKYCKYVIIYEAFKGESGRWHVGCSTVIQDATDL
jgi:hypothetical protein